MLLDDTYEDFTIEVSIELVGGRGGYRCSCPGPIHVTRLIELGYWVARTLLMLLDYSLTDSGDTRCSI